MSQSVVVAVDADSWPDGYSCANFLLGEGARILWATQPFASVTNGGGRKEHQPGSFLITEVPADGQVDWVSLAEERFEGALLRVVSVEGFEGLPLHPLRIGIYGGGGGPFNHARIFAELGFVAYFISPYEIRRGKLTEFDVLVVPGGGALAMKGQLDPLGEEGCQAIVDFVRDGGMYMGFCAGAFDAAIVSDSFLAICPQQRKMQLANAAVWNRQDTQFVGIQSPGVGVIESRNLQPEHPVMIGLPERFPITHYNGPIFEPCVGSVEGASEPVGLASVAGFTERFTPSEYFLRFSEFDRSVAEQTSLLSRAAREGHFNIVAGCNGLGRVLLFGSHPEFGDNLTGDRWGSPARMLANAAFWQASHLIEPRSLSRRPAPGTSVSFPLGSGLRLVSQRLGPVADAARKFRQRSEGTDPAWLAQEFAMSIFGLSGEEIWRRNMAAFDDVSKELDSTVSRIEQLVQQTSGLMDALPSEGGATTTRLVGALNAALLELEEAIHFRTPEEWHQDFGYEGVLQMMDRTEAMVTKAQDNLDATFEPSSNPYQYFDSSPYQLMVGSYLAALGVLTNAWFLLQIQESRLTELAFKGQAVLEAI